MRALLIAEKASLMRAVQAAVQTRGFKDHLDYFALHGHIMSLYDPGEYHEEWQKWSFDTLPLIPEKFLYKVADDRLYRELVNTLQRGHYDYLINCCDPDREGQHIFYSIYDTLGCTLPVYRMWHNDLSDKELIRALNSMEDDLRVPRLVQLKQAAGLRAQMDWLVGMNASRIVTLKRRSVTRLGRVMTPTFRILGDRELAIRNFGSTVSYGIDAKFSEDFEAKMMITEEGKKLVPASFNKKEEAQKKIDGLPDTMTVTEVEAKRTKEAPPHLPSLADIQGEANKAFGYTLDTTLAIVQSLYEKKLVSYPRTDCGYVTQEVAKDFPHILNALRPTRSIGPYIQKITTGDIERVRQDKNYVDDAKVTAHYALIPTGNLKAQFTEEEKKIFELICRRFTCIFLPDYETERTRILLDADGELFQANGSVVLQKGFRELLGSEKKDEVLPALTKGQVVHVSEYIPSEHATKAPSRFTDASLLNAMIHAANYVEDKELSEVLKGDGVVKDSGGIGTPATRAAIVEKIVQPVTNREGKTYYLAYRKGKYFYVTDEGLDLLENIRSFDISSPELTAVWEKKLQEVEEGSLTETKFSEDMTAYTIQMTEQMMQVEYARVIGSYLKCSCPICKGRMKSLNDYYICENYKKENGCTFVLPKVLNGANIREKTVASLCNGEEIPAMKMKSPKSGKEFYAGLKYDPEEKRVKLLFEETHYSNSVCPVCGKRIAVSQNYYMCEDYRKEENSCSFIVPRKLNGAVISEKTLADLCEGKMTSVLKMKSPKSGKDFYASLQYNRETGRTEMHFEQDHDTGAKCPVCSGRVLSTANYYMCEQYKNKACSFILNKEFHHADISERMIRELCAGEKTKAVKIRSEKTGKSYFAFLKLNEETHNIDLEFEDGHPTKYRCPICGEGMLKKSGPRGDYLICRAEDFSVNYVISGRKLKEAEMAEFLEKKELKASGFKGKNGKPFSSKLIIEDGKVGFYFGKKKEKNEEEETQTADTPVMQEENSSEE